MQREVALQTVHNPASPQAAPIPSLPLFPSSLLPFFPSPIPSPQAAPIPSLPLFPSSLLTFFLSYSFSPSNAYPCLKARVALLLLTLITCTHARARTRTHARTRQLRRRALTRSERRLVMLMGVALLLLASAPLSAAPLCAAFGGSFSVLHAFFAASDLGLFVCWRVCRRAHLCVDAHARRCAH